MALKRRFLSTVVAAALAATGASPVAGAGIDVVELTAKDAAAGLQARTYTSRQLTEAFLARIARYNPGYNAIITLNPAALAEADAIDRRRAAGEALGPLAGVPVVVKDTMDVAGLPTTAGWSLLSARAGGIDLIPETDAPVVARLRTAGAVILGKTNVPVLSLSATNANDSWAGPTYNAAAPSRAPGGSSAGTAAAVAGSLAVLGLAEETGGSIQNPAAAQGLVSVKPTFALVPNTGVFPIGGSTRDVVGPHAKTVYDASLAMDVLAGFTAADPKTVAALGHVPEGGYVAGLRETALRGKRIGLYGPGWRAAAMTPETEVLYARAVAALEAEGAVVVRDPFAGSGFAALAKPGSLGGYDARGEESAPYDLNAYLARLGPKAAVHSLPELAARIGRNPFDERQSFSYLRELPGFLETLANPARTPDLDGFRAVREQHLRVFDAVMAHHRLDALVFPQMRAEGPPLFGRGEIADTTVSEINIGGFPGVTVPAGDYRSGAPFGLLFVGRLWSEGELLAMAYDYEQSTKLRRAPVLVDRPKADPPPARQ
jgi:Asp-tRNA(Asn)/Glu-tRNA(Gln) amidotransferase A subunit family amidase